MAFSQIACDQAIEQTINRDSRTKSCNTGITLRKNAVSRWIPAHHVRAGISAACQSMAGKGADHVREKNDLDINRINKDENSEKAVIRTSVQRQIHSSMKVRA